MLQKLIDKVIMSAFADCMKGCIKIFMLHCPEIYLKILKHTPSEKQTAARKTLSRLSLEDGRAR